MKPRKKCNHFTAQFEKSDWAAFFSYAKNAENYHTKKIVAEWR